MELWNFSSEAKNIFFSGETATSSVGLGASEILCSNVISPNSCFLSLVDDESGSRALSSLMESNTDKNDNNNNIRDSSLIALKLGSQPTGGAGHHCLRLRETTQISSPSSSSPFKRARTRGCCSQTTPYCQVLGCNMDLSDSKDYHKKHKVCDAHSKTSRVIVHGFEQRFCQQCSRFHLLKEFDDGKRSCRRRLAGHNERRRKPQCDSLSDKPHKYSHFYQGNRYLGTSIQNQLPFAFSDILPPGVILSPENYDQVNPFGQMVNSRFPYHRSSEKEDEDCFYGSAPTLHRPLGASSPLSAPRAHSFLSSQSPQPTPQGRPHETVPQSLQEKLPRAQLRPCSSSGIDPFELVMVPELARPSDFEAFSDRVFHGSDYLHHKYCFVGPENGSSSSSSTVDLLQLSSHLQRVEHQRSFMQVKQENDEFSCFITA